MPGGGGGWPGMPADPIPAHRQKRGGGGGWPGMPADREPESKKPKLWPGHPAETPVQVASIEEAMVTWNNYKRDPFKAVFYQPMDPSLEDPDVAAATREELEIQIEDDPYGDCPAPVRSFEEVACLPKYLLENLKYQGFASPMPIQSQSLPLVLSGRNVIGLAQTGSGKTLAFLLPAVVHIEAQQPLVRKGKAWATPIALVLAPTRELAVQISEEACKVTYGSKAGRHVVSNGINSVCVYGGGHKHSQKSDMARGTHILVATPGRMIDFMKDNTISLARTTYFVLDEADRMLDMGFQGDVNNISKEIRPERQVLFFSATWNTAVQQLASGLCLPTCKPVRISFGQGDRVDGEDADALASKPREGITQEVVVVDLPEDDGTGRKQWMRQDDKKRMLLEAHLRKVLRENKENKILVFVSQKTLADELAEALVKDGFKADAMHGGRGQEVRLWVLDQFRQGKLRVLVATDVLGRGIDIPSVSHVVINEMGMIADYVHRIGRTGRGREGKGHALVFFEYYDKNPEIAGQLIKALEASKQHVPPELQKIADEVAAGVRKSYETRYEWSKSAGGGSWSGGGRGSWNDRRGDSDPHNPWGGGGGGYRSKRW
eukprot:TRINITY_DN76772_c0_g1_i1.p1 TRINITY_DN76772_c0_g1~~TRINITY_DN76772_c0_g1_i1.p1  ORF type:complete len:604 (+),score=113.62 TRINITY_DN76772_c0_g1_i1:149-1960(+)